MPAPSGTLWGSTVGSYGRIGLYINVTTNNATTYAGNVEVWFWSKYSVDDTSNTLYFNNLAASGSATESKGSKSVKTTVASGAGWSTTNQVRLVSYGFSYTKGTSVAKRYIYAKLTNIDRVGGTMYASTTFDVPKLASYTVAYNANGGSGAPSSQTKWHGKALTISSTKPTKSGYTFQGWATSASGGVAYASGASYTGNAALTLYAVWKANTYTVKFDANGGTGAPANQTKTHGTTLKLSSTKPTRANYNFIGWGTSANATTATYQAGGNYTANAAVTLYAVWETAYIAPKILHLSAERCDANGNITDEGTCAALTFTYETFLPATEIRVSWQPENDEIGGASTASFPPTATGNTMSCIVGNNALVVEATYIISVQVLDGTGSAVRLTSITGQEFPMDVKKSGSGYGVSVGKAAEEVGLFDVGYTSRFVGGIRPPVLEPNTDLNDVKTPNTYMGENTSHYNYANCPVTSGTFTLLVESCGEDGQVKQTYTTCSKYKPERYSRFFYQGEWGAWFWANTDEYILFESASGEGGSITLAAAASHFRYIEIYFTDNNGKTGGYTKVYSPNGKNICLQIIEPNTQVYSRQTLYAIVGTTMMPDIENASYFRVNSNNTITTSFGTNYIRIVRVIGRA